MCCLVILMLFARRNEHLHDPLPQWTVIAVDMAVMLGCCCLSLTILIIIAVFIIRFIGCR